MNLRRRVTAILYIVSIAVSIFLFTAVLDRAAEPAQSTSYTWGFTSGEDVFFAENRMGQGLIYRMSQDGRVQNLFSSLTTGDGQIRALAAGSASDEAVVYAVLAAQSSDADGETAACRIVSLDRRLRIVAQTARFALPADEVLTGFSVEGTGLFLTTVAEDGDSIHVYSIGRDALSEEAGTETIRAESIRTRSAEEGRFFVEARYALGELEVRTDRDAPTASFLADAGVQTAVRNMRLGLDNILVLYRRYIIGYITALLVWFVVLGLLIWLLSARNRMIYSFAVAEAALVLITGIGIYALHTQTVRSSRTEHIRFALLSMEDLQDAAGITDYGDYSAGGYYDSERYHTVREALGAFVRRGGNRSVFYDALIVRLTDGVVVTSASGRNQETLSWLFGTQMDDLVQQLGRGSAYAEEDVTIEGRGCMAVGMAVSGLAANYALVGIVNDTGGGVSLWADNRGALFLFLLIFVMGSMLLVAIWYLQTADLRRFEEALKETALGRSLRARPVVIGQDLKEMWDSLFEVHRLIEETNYSKFKILEAYYRFAPKNIELVLDKPSIMEVRENDSRDFSATLSVVSLADTGGIRAASAMADVIRHIGEYQKEHAGLLTAMSPDLRGVELMFLEEERDTVDFLTAVLCDHMQQDGMPMLSATMLYEACTFGVVGSEEETLPWHVAAHQATIYAFAPFFRELGLYLVISEKVKLREDVQGPLRYIGFVQPEDGSEPIRLYEVLNACPAKQRAERISSITPFAEALALFYEKDFYLARNRFSDILRITPDDALVKWYLFESDRYLEAEADDRRFGSLHL